MPLKAEEGKFGLFLFHQCTVFSGCQLLSLQWL